MIVGNLENISLFLTWSLEFMWLTNTQLIELYALDYDIHFRMDEQRKRITHPEEGEGDDTPRREGDDPSREWRG